MIICAVSILLLVLFDFFWDPAVLPEHARIATASTSTSHLTVMINTFKRPSEVVEDAIEHYKSCPCVKHLYVIW